MGVLLRVVVLVLTGVEVVVGSAFAVSESVSSMFRGFFWVMVDGAISFSFSFLFSA